MFSLKQQLKNPSSSTPCVLIPACLHARERVSTVSASMTLQKCACESMLMSTAMTCSTLHFNNAEHDHEHLVALLCVASKCTSSSSGSNEAPKLGPAPVIIRLQNSPLELSCFEVNHVQQNELVKSGQGNKFEQGRVHTVYEL